MLKPGLLLNERFKNDTEIYEKLLLLFVVVVVAAAAGFTKTASWDIWWHMLTGRTALEQNSILAQDPFSFSFEGQAWPYKDLLADILFYLGYEQFGFPWFAFLKGLVVFAIAISMYQRRQRSSMSLATVIAAVCLVVASVQYRVIDRPVLFSLMFFPLYMMALRRFWDAAGNLHWIKLASKGALVSALLLGWCFLHRGAMMGFVVGLGYVGAMWLKTRSIKSAVVLLVALLATAGLTAFHPQGLGLWMTSFDLTSSGLVIPYIGEWAQLSAYKMFLNFPLSVGFIVSVTIGTVFYFVKNLYVTRTIDMGALVDVTMMLALCCLVYSSVRYIPYAVLYAGFPLVERCPLPLERLTATGRRLRERSMKALLICVPVLLFFLTHSYPYGLGRMPGRFPTGAIDFAKAHGIRGDVMSAMSYSGYVLWEMWPDTRVLIDGRIDLVYPGEFFIKALQSENNQDVFEDLAQMGDANWVLAENRIAKSTHRFLTGSVDWALVYWSEEALIYVRRDEYPQLKELEFRHIDPYTIPSGIVKKLYNQSIRPEVIAEIGGEIKRMLQASPMGPRALSAAIVYFHRLGPEFTPKRDTLLKRLSLSADGKGVHVASQLRQRLSIPAID